MRWINSTPWLTSRDPKGSFVLITTRDEIRGEGGVGWGISTVACPCRTDLSHYIKGAGKQFDTKTAFSAQVNGLKTIFHRCLYSACVVGWYDGIPVTVQPPVRQDGATAELLLTLLTPLSVTYTRYCCLKKSEKRKNDHDIATRNDQNPHRKSYRCYRRLPE